MRRGNLNFTIAIIVSLAAHVLLWPASKRIAVSSGENWGVHSRHASQVTLVLKPNIPDIDTLDQMGEHGGKGTGVQPAKGDTPLKAREDDQDQPFLSRDPIGHGHVGDPPAVNTGIRGQNGHGGQAGGSAVPEQSTAQRSAVNPVEPKAAPAAQPTKLPPSVDGVHAPQVLKEPKQSKDDPTRTTASVQPAEAHGAPSAAQPHTAVAPKPAPDLKAAPSHSETVQFGAAKPDVIDPVDTSKKPTDPLAAAPKIADKSVPSLDDAPTPDAATERVQVALASPTAPAPVPPPTPPAVKSAANPTQVSAPAKAPVPSLAPPSPAVVPTPPAPALVSTGDNRAPGLDKPSADPAQESDSESDPFSKNSISAVLHDGRLEVRDGRKVKTTRPHFLPGAIGAFLSNPDPVLVLKVSIDPAGNVKNVDIIRSTGSVEIDQPCRVAVYDWWFEPAHDKKGKPVADVVLFTIRIR